jgi:hypothetical protein
MLAGIVLMVGATKIVYPAISELVGLSVASSATSWNSVIDAARGDSIGSGILGQSPYLWNGVSFDRQRGSIANGALVDVSRISGSITPADAYANPTTANQMWVLNGLFNGTTWDRARTATADGLASTGIGAYNTSLFNGTTFDRWKSASATNNTETTTVGVARVVNISTWSQTNSANAGTPTTSKASGGGSVRHVATCISVSVAAAATAQPAVQVNLRDGATGAGTIIRSWQLSAPANDSATVDLCGLNMTGSAATAMTIEFAAATAANTQASVNISGYSTP